MPKAPYFPFYAGDWLADIDVSMMTLAQEGAYIRLLAHLWIEHSLPSDEKKLRVLLKGIPKNQFNALWHGTKRADGLKQKFVAFDERLHQTRMKVEIEKYEVLCKANKENANKRWKSLESTDATAMRPQCDRNAKSMRPQCQSESESESDKERPPYSPPGRGAEETKVKKTRTRKRKDGLTPDDQSVLERNRTVALIAWGLQEQLRCQALPGSIGLAATDERLLRIARLLNAGSTLQDCQHVLEVYASDARKSGKGQWFNGVTNWRPGNFETALGRQNPKSHSGQSATLEDLILADRKLAEANGR